MNPDFWCERSVFLTGHTGFKGGWIALWLSHMGARVYGYSLEPPTTPNFFVETQLQSRLAKSTIGDIRSLPALTHALKEAKPSVVIHMAAQSLVRLSYREPVDTYATNVLGTVHLLEAARQVGTVKAIINVTTDKCYENREWVWGYREDEPMGGHDPYSSSKGCAELVTSAYRRSFFADSGIALASVRAGNVIGGGDWAKDRLIPDILRAFESSEPVVIRNPQATRPWQHVLEPLSGYLVLAERLYQQGQAFAESWNFGPLDTDVRSVRWIVEHMAASRGNGVCWKLDDNGQPHEAHDLRLDISKARARLNWQPQWDLGRALASIMEWHRAYLEGADLYMLSLRQIVDHQASQQPSG